MFEQDIYMVREDVQSLEVCVILEGEVQRNVLALVIRSSSGSAQGSNMIILYCLHFILFSST